MPTAFSTEAKAPRARLANTARLNDLPEDMLAGAVATKPGTTLKRAELLQAILKFHSSPERVLKFLTGLPPLCSALLEVLVDASGALPLSLFDVVVRERLNPPAVDLAESLSVLQSALLVVRLTRSLGGRSETRLAILDSVADTVCPLVQGLTLPQHPPSHEAGQPFYSDEERQVIALATLTLHRPIRITKDFLANLSSVKPIAKSVGLEADTIAVGIRAAFWNRLLTRHLDGARPVLRELRRVARDGLRPSPSEELLLSVLPAQAWLPLEQCLRKEWGDRVQAVLGPGLYGYSSAHLGTPAHLRAEFPRAGGRHIALAEHLGHTWVRRNSNGAARSGDGHITPNFEVFLGPRAHPEILMVVGLGCELTRAERVFTFRITPGSVQAAVGLGLDVNELLDVLDRVGPRPTPDNVRESIRDFARRVQLASARAGYLLGASKEALDAYAVRHAQHVLERIGPELVFLRSTVSLAGLERDLKTQGVHLASPVDADQRLANESDPAGDFGGDGSAPEREWGSGDDDDDEFGGVAPARGPTLALCRPAPALAQALAADQASAFAASRRALQKLRFESEAQTSASMARSAAAVGSRSFAQELEQVLMATEEVVGPVRAELDGWARRLPTEELGRAVAGLKSVMALAPYAALRPEFRKRARKAAGSLDELLAHSLRLGAVSRFTHSGAKLMSVLRGRRDLLEAALVATEPDAGPATDSAGASSAAPSTELAAAVAPSRPLAREFPALAPRTLLELLTSAVEQPGGPLYLRVLGAEGERIHLFAPEAIRVRGKSTLLLGTDLDTDEARAFELSHIRSALPATSAAPADNRSSGPSR